jgi:RNA polymerase sigma-70 factor (ECF subfamily)
MQTASALSADNDLPDIELAQRIAAGDRGCLQRMIRRYNQRLYRTARSILKDDAEAEDAVQEAYLLAYRAIGGFRGDAKLSSWLVRIVVNESIERMRRRNRRAEVIELGGDREPEDATTDTSDNDTLPEQPENAAMRAEIRRLLESKIDRLPEAFRVVFVLRAVEDLTVDETAQCLGIPEATVRTRYFRAKALLREALAREIDWSLEDAFGFAGERCDRIVAGVLARVDDRKA